PSASGPSMLWRWRRDWSPSALDRRVTGCRRMSGQSSGTTPELLLKPSLPLLVVVRRTILSIPRALALLGPLIVILLGAQFLLVRWRLSRAVRAQLDTSAARVTAELRYVGDRWNVHGFRSAYFEVDNWYVVGIDGLIIDIEGFLPGLVTRVEVPPELDF